MEISSLTVTTNLDIVDENDNLTSLREALTLANATAGIDTITFDAGVFTGGANSLIRLTEGQLVASEAVNIDASGATGVTITGDANGDDVTFAGGNITDVNASAERSATTAACSISPHRAAPPR